MNLQQPLAGLSTDAVHVVRALAYGGVTTMLASLPMLVIGLVVKRKHEGALRAYAEEATQMEPTQVAAGRIRAQVEAWRTNSRWFRRGEVFAIVLMFPGILFGPRTSREAGISIPGAAVGCLIIYSAVWYFAIILAFI